MSYGTPSEPAPPSSGRSRQRIVGLIIGAVVVIIAIIAAVVSCGPSAASNAGNTTAPPAATAAAPPAGVPSATAEATIAAAPSTEAAVPTTVAAEAPSGPAPRSVKAGSGGAADRGIALDATTVLLLIGGACLLAGGIALARSRAS